MIKLTGAQRILFSDKVSDVANLAIGALFFGQLLGDLLFSASLAVFGVCVWLGLFALALHFARGESP